MSSVIIDTERYRSPNYSYRNMSIDAIIIHHTGGTFPGCAVWLCSKEAHASAHYLITKAGRVYRMVEDHYRAWHAGRSAFDVNHDGKISPVERMWNDRSIGIELEAYKEDGYKYGTYQLHSLDKLVYEKCYEYKIVPDMILGHKEIAPGRKIDPANFDMFDYRETVKRMLES